MSSPPTHTDSRETLDQDTPVTLAEACQIVFRNKVGPDALRAEHRRGRLHIFRVGKKDFVTLRDVREMCRAKQDRPASISTSSDIPGSSGMALSASEQVLALKAKLRLKSGSRNISPENTNRNQHHRH